jgi:hypothetical protein
MFDNNKIFEKETEFFCKYLQNENLKYFPYLKKQLLITKYVNILKNAYELYSIRFSQFRHLDSTLELLINLHNITFDELELSFVE